MSENCRKTEIDCSLKIGDWVDWQRFTNRETTSNRHWHGQIVDEWNSNSPQHLFVVRWDSSDKSGPYEEPKPEFDPEFIPFSPHYEQVRCFELKICEPSSKRHPKKNALPQRAELKRT